MHTNPLGRFARLIAAVFAAAVATCALAQPYESYYLFLGHYPVAETSWSHNVQGVAHDDNNWFITNTDLIWKIPVERDLNSVTSTSTGVIRRTLGSYPALAGYAHFGDPDVHRVGLTDYLIVPIEAEDATCTSGLPGGVAILRCFDLSYVAHVGFPGQCNDAGWVASRGEFLVSSRQHVGAPPGSPSSITGGLRFYFFDWNLLHNFGVAAIAFDHEVEMLNEQGGRLEMVTMQGGEFAPGSDLLYLLSGFHDDSNELADREGIHVLETTTFRRVAHSTRGFGHFDYYYDPGFNSAGEPEGLTVWDLDNGRAPGIRGQLHVMRLDNDAFHDDIAFKHYTSIIRVNPASSCQSGTIACPFRTFGAAYSLAWPGAEIRLRTGTYLDRPVISKRIRLSADGGVVRIGG
ncbi:MAG: hypothetical protein ACT4PL_02345 [Phycisphaerales bacterium]